MIAINCHVRRYTELHGLLHLDLKPEVTENHYLGYGVRLQLDCSTTHPSSVDPLINYRSRPFYFLLWSIGFQSGSNAGCLHGGCVRRPLEQGRHVANSVFRTFLLRKFPIYALAQVGGPFVPSA